MLSMRAGSVLPLDDVIRDGLYTSNIYLKMPYCAGGSLADRLEASSIETPELIFHLLSILVGLGDLHYAGIVHADLKPQNVLFLRREKNNEWDTLISDFGLTYYVQRRRKSFFKGSLAYASPEQLLDGDVSISSDIWSWGLMAYQLSTNNHLYGSLIESVSLDHNLTIFVEGIESIVQKSKINTGPKLPLWLSALINQALSFEPNDRPTAEELVHEFSRYCCFESDESGNKIVFQSCRLFYNLASDDYKWRSSQTTAFATFHDGPLGKISKAGKLLKIGSIDAMIRAVELVSSALGDWEDPQSILGKFKAGPEAPMFNVAEAQSKNYQHSQLEGGGLHFDVSLSNFVTRAILFEALDIKIRCLVNLIEEVPQDKYLKELRLLTQEFSSITSIGSIAILSTLGQANMTSGYFRQADRYFAAALNLRLSFRELTSAYSFAMARRNFPLAEKVLTVAAGLASSEKDKHLLRIYLGQLLAVLLRKGELDKAISIFGLETKQDLENIMLVLLHLILEYRVNKALHYEIWNNIKPLFMKHTKQYLIANWRIFLECCHYYKEYDLCQRIANSLLLGPWKKTVINLYESYFIERIKEGTVYTFLPIQRKLEIDSEFWIENGRTDIGCLTNRPLFAARCWIASKGKNYDGISQNISDFISASSNLISGSNNWDSLLNMRSYCDQCEERYKLENLSVCSSCCKFYCYRCSPGCGIHNNGNIRCTCGGEVTG